LHVLAKRLCAKYKVSEPYRSPANINAPSR
jgi:hypothetical protein